MSKFEDYVERLMVESAKKQANLARDMAYLMSSDVGESFRTLILELVAKMKDDYIFAEEEAIKPEIKGGIRALTELLEVSLELAKQHGEDVTVADRVRQSTGWASADDDEPAEEEQVVPEGPRRGPGSESWDIEGKLP